MNKTILLLTGSVLTFLSSCYSYKEISGQPEFDSYKTRKSVYVLKASTKNDSVFFTEKMPGKLLDDQISGIRQFPLDRLIADSVFFKPVKYKRIVDHVYKNGIRFEAFEEEDKIYVFNNTIPVNIPYSDLESAYLKIFQPGRTIAMVGGFSAGFVGLLILIYLNGDQDFFTGF